MYTVLPLDRGSDHMALKIPVQGLPQLVALKPQHHIHYLLLLEKSKMHMLFVVRFVIVVNDSRGRCEWWFVIYVV